MYAHELWLDEMHHWLLARESNSLVDLFERMKYEGHPILWNALMMWTSRIYDSPESIKVLHWGIVMVNAWIILRYAPLRFMEKLLLLFGYYFFYEYAVISRNYAIMTTFALLSVVFYTQRKYWPFLISVFFLLNTHLLGWCIAVPMMALFVWRIIREEQPYAPWELWVGAKVMLIGMVLSLAQIIPPADHPFTPGGDWLSMTRIARACLVFTKGMLPLPDFSLYAHWNTYFLDSSQALVLGLLTIILIAFTVLLFRKRIVYLLFFVSVSASVCAFIYLTQMNGARYYGVVFIGFVLAIWLVRKNEVVSENRIEKSGLTILLTVHLIVDSITWLHDVGSEFTGATSVIRYLKNDNLVNHTIAVSSYNAGPPISGYLGKPVFYPDIEEYGTYCKWQKKTFKLSPEEMLQNLPNTDSLVLVTNYDLGPIATKYGVQELPTRGMHGISGDQYFIYIKH